jgi:Protein of unknown function (DUF3349)
MSPVREEFPMPLPPLLQTIVDFVRKGYPQGVPQQDYLPLFALLSRRLSDEEINELATELVGSSRASAESVGEMIERLTHQTPSEAEVERVQRHLRAAGWDPETDPEPGSAA